MADLWPTLFIPHGGGPCFFMGPPAAWPRDTWDGMAAFLRGIGGALGRRLRAVLVISGHWEAEQPTLNVAERPPLLFDYYGSPEHTYRLTYPAAGAPELAARVRELLGEAGIGSAVEDARGLDHGVFVPFKLVYPNADVPVFQLSLQRGLDDAGHLAIGRALAPLRREDVLIVGSGMSYHNLRGLFSGRGGEAADAFDEWLAEAVGDPERRSDALAQWRSAPGALDAHLEGEHLLPPIVAAGAAEDAPGTRIYAERVLDKPISGFRFG